VCVFYKNDQNLHEWRQQHLARILDVFLDLHQESGSLSAVNETMIVGKSDYHDGPGLNLAVDWNGAIENGMQTEHS
jgi:hypothetical protein